MMVLDGLRLAVWDGGMKAFALTIITICALVTAGAAVSIAKSLRRLELIPSRAEIYAAPTDEAKRALIYGTPVLRMETEVGGSVDIGNTLTVEIER